MSYCSELLLLPKSRINLPFPLISYFTRITTIQSAMMTQGENDRLFFFFFLHRQYSYHLHRQPLVAVVYKKSYIILSFFFFSSGHYRFFLIAKETHSCLVSTIENTVFRWLLPQNVPEGQCAIEKSY